MVPCAVGMFPHDLIFFEALLRCVVAVVEEKHALHGLKLTEYACDVNALNKDAYEPLFIPSESVQSF